MSEDEWLGCTDPDVMLELLRAKASNRKLRLFASGCCRRVWHLLSDGRSRNAVEAAEQVADGDMNIASLQGLLKGPNQPKKAVADLCMADA